MKIEEKEPVELTPEEEREQAQEDRSAYRSLLRNPGWQLLEQLLLAQTEMRKTREESLDLVEDDKAFRELLALRHERRTLELVLQLPTLIIEELTEELEEDESGNSHGG